ncbi:hypothetical protein Nepgr_006764 [Nepenthes gracilis]|uniref:Uncharacterized protein n=1 Tax=Nepenthes gracilis TaxID=150966 RepID=A0AAD3S5N7_NEPGR|nr:hypothetical protein Nepgr_006764 [Nepenthes gracilis]
MIDRRGSPAKNPTKQQQQLLQTKLNRGLTITICKLNQPQPKQAANPSKASDPRRPQQKTRSATQEQNHHRTSKQCWTTAAHQHQTFFSLPKQQVKCPRESALRAATKTQHQQHLIEQRANHGLSKLMSPAETNHTNRSEVTYTTLQKASPAPQYSTRKGQSTSATNLTRLP